MADLHIHSVLSPCADYRMVPELIVEQAIEAGLDLVAITDHNSAENAAAVVAAAMDTQVVVIGGMEVECREGVHVLTLFDSIEPLELWQETVYRALPDKRNRESLFGVQLVVSKEGRLVRQNERLLITAADLSLQEVLETVRGLGGICIPAHIDRPAYGLISVLGFVPEGAGIAALEVSPFCDSDALLRQHPELSSWALIRSSDAHTLEQISAARTAFMMSAPSIRELDLACRGKLGRGVIRREKHSDPRNDDGYSVHD